MSWGTGVSATQTVLRSQAGGALKGQGIFLNSLWGADGDICRTGWD